MREFRRTFDLFNTMFNELGNTNSESISSDFVPAINTREGEFAYHVEVDLPGVNKDDIEIKVEDNTLIISGERKVKEEIKEENYYKVESRFGSFTRSFALPEEADVENIHAESTDGVLEVVVPKLESAKIDKVKKIAIS
jgi:HSP20 family protein